MISLNIIFKFLIDHTQKDFPGKKLRSNMLYTQQQKATNNGISSVIILLVI